MIRRITLSDLMSSFGEDAASADANLIKNLTFKIEFFCSKFPQ